MLFADVLTGSIRALLEISDYRRTRQEAYNKEHGITPRSVVRAVQESLHVIVKGGGENPHSLREDPTSFNAVELIRELEKEMAEASARLEYERAALLRDQIAELKSGTGDGTTPAPMKKISYSKPSRKKRG